MTIKDTETISHLFNERLKKYEDKIAEFLLDIARSKRVNPKISTISSYILIHEKLTQKEIAAASGITGVTLRNRKKELMIKLKKSLT